jgi:hypothetical protein
VLNREQLKEDFEITAGYSQDMLGYAVYLCDVTEGLCDFSNKRILISSRLGVEKRLYILIHEVGHILIRNNWKKFQTEYSGHANVSADGRRNWTEKFRISTVEEEIEAWKRGKRAAKRLGIEINEEKFNKFKTKCLMSYVSWAAGNYK